MKFCFFSLYILFLNSCNNQVESVKNMSHTDSLNLSIQGSWKGDTGGLVWDIGPDSIFYYSENKSYYYFIHKDDMIVLYKNGPYKFKNIRVKKDSLFFTTQNMNIIAIKSENTNSFRFKSDYFENDSEDETSNNTTKNKILGKWGYEYDKGVFSWVFTKDSIFYIQLNKQYFYVQHDNDIIVLTEENPTIMKDIAVKSDTLSFTAEDNVLIKAHKIK